MSQIDAATKDGRVHEGIGTQWDSKGVEPKQATPTIPEQCGFVKASELISIGTKKRLAYGLKPHEDTLFVPPLTPSVAPPTSGNGLISFEGFISASSLLKNSVSNCKDSTNDESLQTTLDKYSKLDKNYSSKSISSKRVTFMETTPTSPEVGVSLDRHPSPSADDCIVLSFPSPVKSILGKRCGLADDTPPPKKDTSISSDTPISDICTSGDVTRLVHP